MDSSIVLLKKIRNALPKQFRESLPREVALIEISKEKSRTINRTYRKKNKPANVLSFRYGSAYGEILLCPDVIRKEARASGNSYSRQRAWMVLHGILHMAGIHHERSEAVLRRVEKIERKVLQKMFGKQM